MKTIQELCSVDLTLPIVEHWRFQPRIETVSRISDGGLANSSRLTLGSHAFTHVDPPAHMIPGGKTLDQLPLDVWWGDAMVVDLTHMGDNEAIGASDLEERGGGLVPGDIALLRTDLGLRVSWQEGDFWDRSPFVDRSGAEWLANRGVKAVGYDFPQDYSIRELRKRKVTLEEMPCHDVLLGRGIVQIEYLCNLHLLTQARVLFFAMPLSLGPIDGSPCRAFALQEATPDGSA